MINEELKHAIKTQLPLGKDYALHGNLLAQRLGEGSTRQIRLAIQELIQEGIPICGSAKYGYFIATTPEESKECLEQLMSYLKMIAQHHKYLLRASRDLIRPGQLSMRL